MRRRRPAVSRPVASIEPEPPSLIEASLAAEGLELGSEETAE